jgi:voltage-gated potassium channel Kch
LIAVTTLAVSCIFMAALIMYNVESALFPNFFSALYWATITMTSVGYGDIAPTTVVGRLVSMGSSVIGIAIVALPTGIITAGFMKEILHPADKTAVREAVQEAVSQADIQQAVRYALEDLEEADAAPSESESADKLSVSSGENNS